jgi:hypothetical protein
MAFKLLVEVTEDGALNVNHEGQIDPVILIGALRTLEHNILMTVDALAAEAAMNALGGQENEEAPEGVEGQEN